MKKYYKLRIKINRARDVEEIAIILDQIKRQIFDGYYGGSGDLYDKSSWDLKEVEKHSRARS